MVIGIKSSYSTPVDKDLNKTIDVFIWKEHPMERKAIGSHWALSERY